MTQSGEPGVESGGVPDPHTVDLADCTVGIVGLGLIGSSLGMSLGDKVGRRIGFDRDPRSLIAAVDRSAVEDVSELHAFTGPGISSGVARALASCDIVVIALPVQDTVRSLAPIASAMRHGTVLTDVASAKRVVTAAMADLPVHGPIPIGGHPMAGRPGGGHQRATPDLFVDATWVVSTVPGRPDTRHAFDSVRAIIGAVGARVLVAGAADHDRAAAMGSHLPFAVGAAMLGAVEASPLRDLVRSIAANGMARTTRGIRADIQTLSMWRDVLDANADEVCGSIDLLIRELVGLRDRVALGGEPLLQHLADSARSGRFLDARDARLAAARAQSRRGGQS